MEHDERSADAKFLPILRIRDWNYYIMSSCGYYQSVNNYSCNQWLIQPWSILVHPNYINCHNMRDMITSE